MRRLFRLVSWDYGTDSGIATDGTKFEDEIIPFTILGRDLEPEHNGHLILEEVFSAEEAPGQYLYDVMIEQGPRSAIVPEQPSVERPSSDYAEMEVESSRSVQAQIDNFSDDHCAAYTDFDADPITDTWHNMIENLELQIKQLENRVAALEGQTNA